MADAYPYFYLLPGVGFGFDEGGIRHAIPIAGSVERLRRVAHLAASRIVGVEDTSLSGRLDLADATKLYAVWSEVTGATAKLPANQLLFAQHDNRIDLSSFTGSVRGLRRQGLSADEASLLRAVRNCGLELVPDQVSKTPVVHHLPFLRHPYISSEDKNVVAEGKGFDAATAKIGALCEAIERTLANRPNYGRSVSGKTANSLRQDGLIVPAIEPGTRDCYSDEFPTDWTAAWVYPGLPAALPSELVWFTYNPRAGFRAFDLRHTIGLAAGASEAEAVANGILECLERDAYALVMRCRMSTPTIPVDILQTCGDEFTALIKQLREAGVESHFKWINLDYPVPIAHVLLKDMEDRLPAHSHGCSAALEPSQAITRALLEAVQMHHGLSRVASTHWEHMASRVETCHSHPRFAWGDPLFFPALRHLAIAGQCPARRETRHSKTIQELCDSLVAQGRRIFWAPVGEMEGVTVVRVLLEGAVSPDSRQEDRTKRLAEWVRHCQLPSPYSDPILS